MVNIYPVCDTVRWPSDEGVLGVVGIAPWATLEFCQQLYALTHVQKDWDYPRVIIDGNCKIPSRGRHLQLGERDPSPFIQATINELASMGATVAVVPCNTAHILWPRWSVGTTIPVINIVDATVASLSPGNGLVAVLGSSLLCASRLYSLKLMDKGRRTATLTTSMQLTIDQCISMLKTEKVLNEAMLTQLHDVVRQLTLQGVTTFILACTELSLLKEQRLWEGVDVVDSSASLAQAALTAISYRKLR